MIHARKIVLASTNAGKLREIEPLLAGAGIQVISQAAFNIGAAEETGLSFVENALIKARHAALQTGHAAIADDSGLEVRALNGQPGIHSARYAGPGANDAQNRAKLIAAIRPLSQARRRARFVCVMAYLERSADPLPVIATGVWQGELLTEPRGANGFGYDPLFYLPRQRCTAAELTAGRKNRLSHRGRAARKLARRLRRAAAADLPTD